MDRQPSLFAEPENQLLTAEVDRVIPSEVAQTDVVTEDVAQSDQIPGTSGTSPYDAIRTTLAEHKPDWHKEPVVTADNIERTITRRQNNLYGRHDSE